MKYLLILSFFELVGCSLSASSNRRIPTHPAECTSSYFLPEIDARARIYTEDFFREAEARKVHCVPASSLSFQSAKKVQEVFKDEKLYVIGYCTSDGKIVLNENAWAYFSDVEKRALVFHELGHCILNLGHSDLAALNLMAPQILTETQLTTNWPLLVEKLFTKSLLLEDSDVLRNRFTVP